MTEQDCREKNELKKWKEFSLAAIIVAAFAVLSIYFDFQTFHYILAARDLCTFSTSCAANLATERNLTSDAITSLGGSLLVSSAAITTIIATYVGTRISIKIQKSRN